MGLLVFEEDLPGRAGFALIDTLSFAGRAHVNFSAAARTVRPHTQRLVGGPEIMFLHVEAHDMHDQPLVPKVASWLLIKIGTAFWSGLLARPGTEARLTLPQR
ncbi:MAG: hypothetical protein AB7K24_25955 [Gemmataceae bacterium]